MECMICYEIHPVYQLKGCTHTICTTCSEKLKDKERAKHAFSCTFTMTIDEGVKCIKCPYCRIIEPHQFNMNALIKEYKADYKFWIELEMKFDGEKSVARDITREYFLGKKRMVIKYFVASKGSRFARYYDDTTSRYRKMPFSKKDQLDKNKLHQKHYIHT
jgi:hypothetical protein